MPAESIDPSSNPQNAADPTPLPPDMGHFGTNCDTHPAYNLTAVQLQAIELTIQGFNDIEVADILSINRKTLWRWKTDDPEYSRAITDTRADIHASIADRYRSLLMRATGVMAKFLEDEADNNRFRASHALLMMVGAFKPLPSPPRHLMEDYFPPPMLPPKMG